MAKDKKEIKETKEELIKDNELRRKQVVDLLSKITEQSNEIIDLKNEVFRFSSLTDKLATALMNFSER